MDAFVLLGSFLLLMLIGMPVAFALGLAALVGALWIGLPLDGVMIQIASGVNKFSLLAIPCFVLAGAIMAEGGMARRLVAFAGVLVGFVRGGLSLVNILASTFFGAISGSSVADTASIGSVLIPEMEKNGYPRPFSTAVTVSGSVQAILIPPSHNAVIYSMAAGGSVSVAALFIAEHERGSCSPVQPSPALPFTGSCTPAQKLPPTLKDSTRHDSVIRDDHCRRERDQRSQADHSFRVRQQRRGEAM